MYERREELWDFRRWRNSGLGRRHCGPTSRLGRSGFGNWIDGAAVASPFFSLSWVSESGSLLLGMTRKDVVGQGGRWENKERAISQGGWDTGRKGYCCSG